MNQNPLKIEINARGQPVHVKHSNGINEWFDYGADGKIIKYVNSLPFAKYKRKRGYYEYIDGVLTWTSLNALNTLQRLK